MGIMRMDTTTERDGRLAELLEALLQQQREGNAPQLDRFAAAYPDLADELRELWSAAQVVDALAPASSNSTVGARSSAPSIPPAIDLPRALGDYQLLAELGRGGMGVVYKAHQQSLDRTVAVKVLLSGALASEADQARFRAEAESAARLEHPGIVPVYDVGVIDSQPFFSMKYVEGTTLARRLAEGPLPPREAAEILAEVSRAIDFAHHRGVLHRDLKPSNILLDADGRPLVSDFGLAKRITGGESLTRSGAVLGTPSYMAPEQAAGSRGQLGPASDVYSLGTILYQMLTGRPPFQAATPVDTVLLVLEQEPLPPRVINAAADRDLEMIALRCLQKPVELRYPTAGLLAEDLEAFLAGEPVSARSGGFSQVMARWFRPSHHAVVLENWGLLWMWHALALLVLCLLTNWFQWQGVTRPWPYLALWGGGLAVWAPIFWALRRRSGPVTFVERQIAHVWGGSVIACVMLFVVEWILGLGVLTLSPVLGLVNGMVYVVKAGILSGEFYFPAAAMFATAVAMAVLQRLGVDLGVTLFGIVAAATFFIPGLKYHRQRVRGGRE